MFRTAFLIALFLLPNLALAQTFNVSTTAQLRSAFENAAVNGEDDTIILEAGTYKTTDDSLGTFIMLYFPTEIAKIGGIAN